MVDSLWWRGVAGVLALVLTSACGGTSVPGTPRAAAPVVTTTSAEPPPKRVGSHGPGDCLAIVDNAFQPVGCEREHQAEVALSDHLPTGFPAGYPPVGTTISPTCRDAMAAYLGGPDAEATRLEHRVLWPTPEQWAAGERWFACAMLERGPDNKAATRTGSVKGALAAGLGALRRCYAGEPLDEPTRVVPCDQPHRSEAVPGVVRLGSHTDPAPGYGTMMELSMDRCIRAVEAYLGGSRPGVTARSVMPAQEYWPSGATTAVCYAISTEPVTGTLGAR
ncbi:septum formation family protein [Actinosynnema sp. NPDC002837]